MSTQYEDDLAALMAERCPGCQGSGQQDDAGIGDIYYNSWVCRDCDGLGYKPKPLPKFEDDGTISCPHDPRTQGSGCGMYHCPACGSMVVSDLEHPTDAAVRFTGLPAYGDS